MCVVVIGAGSFINSTATAKLVNVTESVEQFLYLTPDQQWRALDVVVFTTKGTLKPGDQVLWQYSYGKEIHGHTARDLLTDAQLTEFLPTFSSV